MSTTMAKIIRLCLGLSVCCLTSQSSNVTIVNPGENISIGCDNDREAVYWYLQRSGCPPTPILRSFGGATIATFYYGTGPQSKYNLEAGNRLFIHNFTTEDCATYYCAELRDGVFRFFNGTRLNVTEVVTGLQNLTTCTPVEERCIITTCYPFFIATIILSLILVIIILVFVNMLKRSNKCRPAKTLEEPRKHLGLTYSETEMSASIYTELLVPVSANCHY